MKTKIILLGSALSLLLGPANGFAGPGPAGGSSSGGTSGGGATTAPAAGSGAAGANANNSAGMNSTTTGNPQMNGGTTGNNGTTTVPNGQFSQPGSVPTQPGMVQNPPGIRQMPPGTIAPGQTGAIPPGRAGQQGVNGIPGNGVPGSDIQTTVPQTPAKTFESQAVSDGIAPAPTIPRATSVEQSRAASVNNNAVIIPNNNVVINPNAVNPKTPSAPAVNSPAGSVSGMQGTVTRDVTATPADRTLLTGIRGTMGRVPSITAPIHFNVQNGTVTLTGTVANQGQSDQILSTVQQSPGVVSVDNQLQVAADSSTSTGAGNSQSGTVNPNGGNPGFGFNPVPTSRTNASNRIFNNNTGPTSNAPPTWSHPGQ